MSVCPASREAVVEAGGECPLCGEPADAHRVNGGDEMALLFDDEPVPLADGLWHGVVVAVDLATKTMATYVDGKLIYEE